MISSYKVVGKKIRITTPFCEPLVDLFRAMGGRFENGAWSMPIERLEEVQAQLGANQDDQVEVEIGMSDIKEDGSTYLLGWFVVARRLPREAGLRLQVNATLIHGQIGAAADKKTPRVGATADSVFRMWVPRDFAEARFLRIVQDPVAQAADEAKAQGSEFKISRVARCGDQVCRNGERIGIMHCWTGDGVSVMLDARIPTACGLQADHIVVTDAMFASGEFTWVRAS